MELAPLLRDVFRGQPPAALLHQRQNRLVNLLGRRLVVGDEGGFHIALFDVCRQQTQGAQSAGGGWDEHRVDAHLLGQVDGVEGTGAAVGHQGEIGGVVAFFHGNHTDGPGHVGVDDADDALGRCLHGESHRVCNRFFMAARDSWASIFSRPPST